MTLARRHFQRVTAAAASATAEAGEPINASAYELQLAKLAEDKRRLKEIQSIERKVEVKRQLLPDYAPWVDGVLEAGRGGQDAVLMTVMVWRIDAGEYLGALQIAEYALQHDLAMPDQYQRGVATLVAEEVSDQALAALSTGKGFDYQLLEIVERLTADHDMPDEVRAKVRKALGLSYIGVAGEAPFTGAAFEHANTALEHLRRARELHERCGVKKDIERLERAIKNSSSETVTAGEAGASGEFMSSPGAPPPAPEE
jgi:hypothetical protein